MFGLIFGIIILLVGIIGFGILRAGDEAKVFAWPALTVSLIVCVVSIFLSCVSNVGTGKTGVVTTFGKIEEYTLDSGFHFVAPWNKVTEIDTTINEIKVDTPAYTKDSQTRIESKIENRIMSVSKSIVSSKKADDLLTNRTEVVSEIAIAIDEFSSEYYIDVAAVNLTNIDFTDEYEAAVVLNRLAGINGWNVALDDVTGLYRLYNTDGTEVTESQRQEGVKRLIEYYYTQTWNGELPDTLVTEDSISGIILG